MWKRCQAADCHTRTNRRLDQKTTARQYPHAFISCRSDRPADDTSEQPLWITAGMAEIGLPAACRRSLIAHPSNQAVCVAEGGRAFGAFAWRGLGTRPERVES